MTTPSQNIAVVDANGTTRQVPAFELPGGPLAAAYVAADPVTGHGANVVQGFGNSYAQLMAAGATVYNVSAANSTSANLASGASFVGTWEALPNQSYVSLNGFSSHPIRLVVEQAQDAAGLRPLPPLIFYFSASFNQLVPVNGNYVRITATNIGTATTTTLVIDTQYTSSGIPTTDSGAVAVGIAELMGMQREARGGTLFVGRNNLTPGTATAITTAARTVYAATEAALCIRNTNAAGGTDLHVRKLQLIAVAAGTGLTALDAYVAVDTANRYSSGGTVMAMNGTRDKARSPGAEVRFGPVTTTGGGGAGEVFLKRLRLRTGAPVIGDTFKIAFGSEPTTEFGAVSGTTAQMFGHSAPPLIIPPGGTGLVFLWGAGMTAAPTFEVELIMAER